MGFHRHCSLHRVRPLRFLFRPFCSHLHLGRSCSLPGCISLRLLCSPLHPGCFFMHSRESGFAPHRLVPALPLLLSPPVLLAPASGPRHTLKAEVTGSGHTSPSRHRLFSIQMAITLGLCRYAPTSSFKIQATQINSILSPRFVHPADAHLVSVDAGGKHPAR
jgi:hypothetical protein